MPKEVDFQFECHESYVGTVKEIKEKAHYCQSCGHELILSHTPDHKNLLMQEDAHCINCGKGNRKIIHIIN